jgi:membrane protein YdbS with pleckstrin-like domain
MKKITLAENEAIQYKMKFGKRILFFDAFIIVLLLFIHQSLNERSVFFAILIIVGLLTPMIIITAINFIRVVTHRIYLTNLNIYLFKGYFFKRITILPLNGLTAIYKKQTIFDKRLGLMNLQIHNTSGKKYTFKGVKDSQTLLDFISGHIVTNAQKSSS